MGARASVALIEGLVVDKRVGFFVSHDLPGYEMAVHVDTPHHEVTFVGEVDPTAGPLQADDLVDVGLTGCVRIANAVYKAMRIWVGDYPTSSEMRTAMVSRPALAGSSSLILAAPRASSAHGPRAPASPARSPARRSG